MEDKLSKRNIPKRLEEDLANMAKFKPSLGPRKNVTVGDVLAHSVESAMFDEFMGPVVNRRPSGMTPKLEAALAANNARKAASAKETPSTSSSASSDMMVSLLARLTDCESELKLTRKQLAEKLRRITELEDENKELKALLAEPSEVYEELDFLKGQNQDLTDKLHEMEDFLRDYGLVWVGKSQQSSKSESSIAVSKSSANVPSFSTFAKKIQELNDIINSEPAQVVTQDNGKITKLARPSEILQQIKVIYYANGLMVRRGPFRENNSESYKLFTRDVMDGYFPSEFRDEYPDGVVFVLIDKHEVEFDSSNPDDVLSSEQLLQKLPKTVIRNGEIIDVRNSVQGIIGSSSSQDEKRSNPATVSAESDKKREQIILESMGFRHCNDASRKPVTSQVRWVDGSMIIIKLDASEDVGTIRSLLNSHCEEHSSKAGSNEIPEYELRTVWPARCVDDNCSLVDAGLVPNGTLHAVRVRR